MSINRDEWLAALAEAQGVDLVDAHPDAVTVRDFMALMGMCETNARRRLRLLVQQGRAERLTKRFRDTSGHLQTACAYRLLPKETPDAGRSPGRGTRRRP